MTRVPRRSLALFVCLALAASGCAELADQLTHLPKLKRKHLRFTLAQSSKVFDADGNLIRTLHETENRTIVPLSKVPKHVQQAVIAIEDERFYEHRGVDFRAILRALVRNAASGEIREGGSTITQQLVKNVIIAKGGIAEQTLERKISEAALSRQLEERLSKKDILESYLNTVYFGEGAYGIEEAAQTFFGKSARKLTLGEGALLAGLIRSPEDYNPYSRPAAAKERRNLVLAKMAELGWADPAQAEEAARKRPRLQEVSGQKRYPAPYFMDYVQRLITYDPRFAAVGDSVEERTNALFSGGLRIYTTVDLGMQTAAENAVRQALPNPGDPHAALVAIDPATGHVKALVGGRDWFAPRKQDPFAKLNLALLAEPELGCIEPRNNGRCGAYQAPGTGRQAGSAFKTFALVAALGEGISLDQTYKAGSQIVIPGADAGADYVVNNYEGGDFGKSLSLLDATVFSVNVVYAQLIQDVGPEDVAEIAYEMGINTPLCETCLSAVLGSNEVNALDMASAYGVLANNGERVPPVAITRIESADGKVIYENESEPEQVVEPGVAYLATTALQQVIQRGTGARYGNIGRPAAGKTGTAQEYRDAWFVGYTPDLVASVWVGYPEGQIEMKPSCAGSTGACRPTRTLTGSGVTGGSFPTLIWGTFMRAALAGTPVSGFVQPSGGFVRVTIDTRKAGCLAGPSTPDEFRVEATFVAGTEPDETCKIRNAKIEVPSAVGLEAAEAQELLESYGFETAVVERAADGDYGTVLEQSPAAGTEAPEGSTVTLYVASREGEAETTTVPNVIGLTAGAARARLHEAGYRVRTVYQRRDEGPRRKGRVWDQVPEAGSELESGSLVTIYVDP